MKQCMEWISIKKRLPKKDALYLIFAPSMDKKKPLKATAWYRPGYGWSLLQETWIKGISHWIKFPDNPEDKKEN